MLRIATRKSQLALWQAEHVKKLLRGAHADLEVELLPITTQGDRIQDKSLATIGGKGLFIKELETAMQEGRADLAVHSMKDVPADMPEGFCIAAVLERADPRDALVVRGSARSLHELPKGARVGSSSLRRQAQLYALRPDLSVETLRGNVDTRLRKLEEGNFDAILLACAGLDRLQLSARITCRLEPELCLPAVGQGVIGIECRDKDARTLDLLAALNHTPTRTTLAAERAFAQRLGGSCTSPIAGYAQLSGNTLHMHGVVAEPDGSRLIKSSVSGTASDPSAIGVALAEKLLAAGAEALLAKLRTA